METTPTVENAVTRLNAHTATHRQAAGFTQS